MKKIFLVLAVLCGLDAWPQKVDQGAPGRQGPWPVTLSGSTGDGGSVQTSSAPCTGLAQILTDAGTTPLTVPSVPTPNRIWVQICNTNLNVSTANCICASNSKPASFNAGAAGDTLGVGDCATYNITTQDGGVPWCVCNASNVSLNSTECVP